MPLFSIVIPAYNRAESLAAAIGSVLAQHFTDWELIVVDDGSTDNTAEVVKTYEDFRIKYIYQQNADRSAARNNGIRNAAGSYICFLDSDDLYFPEHLTQLHKTIVGHNFPVALLHTHTTLMQADGSVSRPPVHKQNRGETVPEFYMRNFIGTNCVCIHSTILQKYHFDEALNRAEDSDLFLRIMAEYPVIEIDAYTTVYQLNGLPGDQVTLLKQNRAYIRAWNKIFLHPIVRGNIKASVRNERLLKYYIWMWESSLRIIPLPDLLKDLVALSKLSPLFVIKPVFIWGVLKKIFFTGFWRSN